MKAFGHNAEGKTIASPVIRINQRTLGRYGPNSVLTALNSSPGVRMEERSPGSYRLNIRGSSIRAPFGVRNVKIYLNGLPVTDPGGQSYFNIFGSGIFQQIEVIKGPSSSLYGAGTGGVMLIDSHTASDTSMLSAEVTAGSYGLTDLSSRLTVRDKSWRHSILFQRQSSDGYRDHSSMERYNIGWFGRDIMDNKYDWGFSFLYGDLKYNTPGGLTFNEFKVNPRASRPAAGSFPSAIAAQAGIQQQQFLAGVSNKTKWTSRFTQDLYVYGQYTLLENPAIQNYGENDEPHTGSRLSFNYSAGTQSLKWKIDAGSEIQKGFTTLKVYNNNLGSAGKLRTLDKIRNLHSLVFSQVVLESRSFIYTFGASLNDNKISYQRFDSSTRGMQKISFTNQFSPRISVMHKGQKFNSYLSISKGYSPPTTAEMFPSGNPSNPDLSAENGINLEAGVKGSFLSGKLNLDISGFLFRLEDAIVQRRTAGGGDYYINAGNSRQQGLESSINFSDLVGSKNAEIMVGVNYSYHHFRYGNFVQLTNDYTGQKIPGQPDHQFAFISEYKIKRFTAVLNYLFNSASPLDDANSVYASQWSVAGIKASYQLRLSRNNILLFAGAENIFDKGYSLGNDINAFGGRYYNLAPGRTLYAGMKLNLFHENN